MNRIIVIIKRGIHNWFNEYRLIKKIWINKYPEKTERYPLSILEKFFMSLFIFIRSFSLVHIKDFFKEYNIKSEISEFYVVIWLLFLIYLLYNPIICSSFLFIIVFYRLIDGLNYRLCIIFVDRYAEDWNVRSVNRSLIILMLNYFEIVIGFAILYLTTKSIGYSETNTIISTPLEGIYFSTITLTTLGYGDLNPINSTGQLLSVIEPIFGFVLIVLVVGVIINGIQDIKERKRT
ncbi:MAG: potassium channel family protein [Candidatus Thermoplasmatota archaeon]|nr:potassium channel family protein [Candidatus Thermoplasmatota archaeon]